MSTGVFDGAVLPVLRDQVDTDIIVRIERLATLARGQFGPWAFESLRYDANGEPSADFPMNWPGCANARVLIAGENFGCGSSRENAVWAIQESGIEVVIAPSFGDIFFANCKANRLLAARVSMADYQTMKTWLSTRLSGPDSQPVGGQVDLTASRVELVDGQGGRVTAVLQVPDDMRQAILNPIDPIDQTLVDRAAIDQFARALFEAKPWLKGPDKGLFGL
jgi:3-isopropylmalate/(R)-2-methylmalate dehydratase small subunit